MVGGVVLRDVMDSDLRVFYEQQLDPEATRMAAFPSRGRDAFMAHWAKIMADETTALQTVIFRGGVAGNVVSWDQAGERNVGYWFGKEYWGQGIASAALSQFLQLLTTRPLCAHVAKHNLASIRVLQKCGFTVSGEARFSDADGGEGEEFIPTLGPAV
jgi:RimJ/RimL family protein N-acetyltransferase